jgi:hypothetical protein
MSVNATPASAGILFRFTVTSWILLMGLLPVLSVNSHSFLPREKIEQISRGVVRIVVADGTASGSVINGSRLIYTNRHVMQGFTECTIEILMDPNKPAVAFFKAELVSFSPHYDLALLKITTLLDGTEVSDDFFLHGNGEDFKGFPVLKYTSDSDPSYRGEEIALLGYPGIGDGEIFFTRGVISSVKHEIFKETNLPAWYRTTAEMSLGNSGGIALNHRGEIIGLPSSVSTEPHTHGRFGNILSIQMINAVLGNNEMLTSWDDFEGSDALGRALDRSLTPTYGEQWVDFLNPPLIVTVISGGEVNSDYISECTGYVSSAPDFRLHLSNPSESLQLLFIADDSTKDATLLVKIPGGGWICNDDINDDDMNPLIFIDDPQPGQYDVWCGSFAQGQYIDGRLIVSDGIRDSDASVMATKSLDYNLDPFYATLKLSSGFTPDPFTISGKSGGEIDISMLNKGNGCGGFASPAPDYRLHWSGATQKLIISFIADSPGMGPVLIINTPDGQWICDGELNNNPMISLEGHDAGQFDIWIGSASKDEYIDGYLIITEVSTENVVN